MSSNINSDDYLVRAVETMLAVELEKAKEELIAKATEDYQLRLRKTIAEAAIRVASVFDLERDQRGITIKVRVTEEELKRTA